MSSLAEFLLVQEKASETKIFWFWRKSLRHQKKHRTWWRRRDVKARWGQASSNQLCLCWSCNSLILKAQSWSWSIILKAQSKVGIFVVKYLKISFQNVCRCYLKSKSNVWKNAWKNYFCCFLADEVGEKKFKSFEFSWERLMNEGCGIMHEE